MADIFALEPNTEQQNNHVPPEIFSGGRAMQQVKSSYATAVSVQKPRELKAVRHRLNEEANLAGEMFYYGWGAGKNRIEGPSVKLACAAARCWGNCAIEFAPVQELADSWIFTALFVDLETGFTMPRQFRQSKKWVVYGKHDEFRKEDIRFQIGQSKAVRNVILNSLPPWLIDQAVSAAKDGVKARIEAFIEKNGKTKAVSVVVSELAKHGVTEEMILAKVGKAKIEAVDIEDLVILRGDLSALENGEAYTSELFGGEKTQDGKRARMVKPEPQTIQTESEQQTSPEPEGDPELPPLDREWVNAQIKHLDNDKDLLALRSQVEATNWSEGGKRITLQAIDEKIEVVLQAAEQSNF